MTAEERMETQENGHTGGGGKDGDTEEFSDGELALCLEQSWSHSDKNGDRNYPWARLVSVDKAYSNIELVEREVSLGRADVVKVNGEEDMHVSKIHCKIWASIETGLVYLTNLRVNLLRKRSTSRFIKVMKFLWDHAPQMLNKVQHGHQKRAIEVEGDSATNPSMDMSGDGPDPKKPKKMMESLDTFKCSICLNVWHDVISVTPCLHSFCNACFSDWYRKSCRDRTDCKCPQCRGSVSSVSRNHTLRSLVEDLLKEDPSLGRSPEDIVELEKTALFKAGSDSQFQFGRNRNSWLGAPDEPDLLDANWVADDVQNSATLTSDEEDEEDDVEETGCVQCTPVEGGSFQCPPGQYHLMCASCGQPYPERTDLESVVQKCQVCSKAYCRTYFESYCRPYFESQRFTPDFERCPKILPLCQRPVIDMPSRTHHGNSYEQEVTQRYIDEQGLSVQAVVRDWLGRLDSGEAGNNSGDCSILRDQFIAAFESQEILERVP